VLRHRLEAGPARCLGNPRVLIASPQKHRHSGQPEVGGGLYRRPLDQAMAGHPDDQLPSDKMVCRFHQYHHEEISLRRHYFANFLKSRDTCFLVSCAGFAALGQ
jgi:hypothetical protein